MKICVTGGAGFIGHHTVRDLMQTGHDVLVIDNLYMGKRENLPNCVPLLTFDVLDKQRLLAAFADFRPEAVLHLAAKVSIRASADGFAEDAEQNFMGTVRMLEAAADTGVRRFVTASSMAVYADSPDSSPVNEEWKKEPLSPYGISKLASEQIVHVVGRHVGMETMALRFFNTFGPGQTITPYVGVITIFIDRILSGRSPVIFGDGEQCRDFVYVKDVASACVRALEDSSTGNSVNIGSGRGTMINDVAALLLERLGADLAPQYVDARPEELRNSVADIGFAGKLIGYSPRFTLADKIDEVISAYRTTARSDA